MEVLVINCGSSSLKFQLIDSDSEKVLAKGICERIGIKVVIIVCIIGVLIGRIREIDGGEEDEAAKY